MKSDQVADKPRSDLGGNFGRLARTGIMDQYTAQIGDRFLCGVKIAHWREFLKVFRENADDGQIKQALTAIGDRVRRELASDVPRSEAAIAIIDNLASILGFGDEG